MRKLIKPVNIVKKYSVITFLLIACFLIIYRMSHISKKEISWDVLGYYLYLPATFVYSDPLLNDITWLKKLNEEKQLAGTLYMITQNEKGENMYFFLMGMSLFYFPFYMLATLYCNISGLPPDGFSDPYSFFLVLGGVIYTITGLFFLRKVLLRFFSETLASILLIIIFFGTNAIQHLTLDNLSTVNIIFMLTSIILWCTIRWHEDYKIVHALFIGICSALMILVKPSEIFVVLIPLLWNVNSFAALKEKSLLFLKNYKSLLIAVFAGLLILLPQLIYWYVKTGHIIYDTYKNPGVGLDLFSPHIFNFLFSYRKGWLLYTPVMIFALLGFYWVFKENRKIFYALLIYFLCTFYIMSSWTEWWYGAGFSARTLIATYPILAICMGYFFKFITAKKIFIKVIIGAVIVFFVFLNQFQWWQYKNYILDPYRTTKKYYWSVFLKTKVNEADRSHLLVFRDFSGKMEFTDEEKYQKSILYLEDFESSIGQNIVEENGNRFYRLPSEQEFLPFYESEYAEMTSRDHVWIKTTLNIRYVDTLNRQWPCLVNTMERKEGVYGYYAPELKPDTIDRKWKKYTISFLTPEIRSEKDHYKCYLWNRSKMNVDIDNVKIEIFKMKENY